MIVDTSAICGSMPAIYFTLSSLVKFSALQPNGETSYTRARR
jgi:hypothetical protein